MSDFDLKNYGFDLPTELIADRPVPDRHSSRLMVYDEATDRVTHASFADLPQFLPPESTLVFNRSKVFPCRLKGEKITGGKVEIFLLSLMAKDELFPCFLKASGVRKVGEVYRVGVHEIELKKVVGDGTFLVSLKLKEKNLEDFLAEFGKIPIPPYIRGGESDEADVKSYQTTFAKELGSVAAPTAGLHFSETLLSELIKKNHRLSYVTLHVGAGTFSPIKTSSILDHKMHEEIFFVDENELEKINAAHYRVAVGTTTLRVLESCCASGQIQAPEGEFGQTSIFLHPGKSVHSINALVTNFHLPESSLIILVSALIGREKTLELYRLAVEKKYRFFSYGDGMIILRDPKKLL